MCFQPLWRQKINSKVYGEKDNSKTIYMHIHIHRTATGRKGRIPEKGEKLHMKGKECQDQSLLQERNQLKTKEELVVGE